MKLSIDDTIPSGNDVATSKINSGNIENPPIKNNLFMQANVDVNAGTFRSMNVPRMKESVSEKGVLQLLLEHYQNLIGKMIYEIHAPIYQIPADSRCRIKEDLISSHTREIRWAGQKHGDEAFNPTCLLQYLKQAQRNRDIGSSIGPGAYRFQYSSLKTHQETDEAYSRRMKAHEVQLALKQHLPAQQQEALLQMGPLAPGEHAQLGSLGVSQYFSSGHAAQPISSADHPQQQAQQSPQMVRPEVNAFSRAGEGSLEATTDFSDHEQKKIAAIEKAFEQAEQIIPSKKKKKKMGDPISQHRPMMPALQENAEQTASARQAAQMQQQQQQQQQQNFSPSVSQQSAVQQSPMSVSPNAQAATNVEGNHALQDFQMQLMLLEQQNKKRLLDAKRERDMVGGTPDVEPCMPSALGHIHGPSPEIKASPSPAPSNIQRGTPRMEQSGLAGDQPPIPYGSMRSPKRQAQQSQMQEYDSIVPPPDQQVSQSTQFSRPEHQADMSLPFIGYNYKHFDGFATGDGASHISHSRDHVESSNQPAKKGVKRSRIILRSELESSDDDDFNTLDLGDDIKSHWALETTEVHSSDVRTADDAFDLNTNIDDMAGILDPAQPVRKFSPASDDGGSGAGKWDAPDSWAAKKSPYEKRVGRRKGPFIVDQKNQVSEIRKLRLPVAPSTDFENPRRAPNPPAEASERIVSSIPPTRHRSMKKSYRRSATSEEKPQSTSEANSDAWQPFITRTPSVGSLLSSLEELNSPRIDQEGKNCERSDPAQKDRKSRRRGAGNDVTTLNPLAPPFNPISTGHNSKAPTTTNVVDELVALWTISSSENIPT